MSTIRANTITDSAGGNTATINGITPALSSQAQAEAGTDNTTLMTPLRAAQAIAALGGSMTLLGTLTTTSGTTQTLSSLTLTDYKQIFASIVGISQATNVSSNISLGGALLFNVANLNTVSNVMATFDLTGSLKVYIASDFSLNVQQQQHTLTTASTSISITSSAAAFDAGTVRIYGVK